MYEYLIYVIQQGPVELNVQLDRFLG